MTLDEWIRAQPSPSAGRRGRMTDGEFAAMIACDAGEMPTQQAVQLWRKGRRRPSPVYAVRIAKVTGGAVCVADLDAAWERRKIKDGK
jgi:DNA-binding transcriptional regulator YdaS (Cro superfamily)